MNPTRPTLPLGATLILAALLFVAEGLFAAPTASPPFVPPAGPGFRTLAAFTLPPTFYVGDRVELRIRLKLDPGTRLRAPAKMPVDRWVVIDSISITHSSEYSAVHLFFVSFAPGRRTLPPINLGGIDISGIQVTTASLTSGPQARLSDPKGQLLLPGTTLIVALLVALLIGLPLAGLVIVRKFTRTLGDFLESRRAHRPWRQFVRSLDALSGEGALLDPRGFYIALVEAVRRYLTSKLERDFRTVTAREFRGAVRSTLVGEEAAAGLSDIMSFSELVKFAGTQASEDTLRRDLSRVREIITSVEQSAEQEFSERHREARGLGERR